MPAEAGVGKEVIKQGVKILCRNVVKETSEELSESAAKKLVREAMKHSDDVAKLAKEFGEEGLVQIVKSPAARRMGREVCDPGMFVRRTYTDNVSPFLADFFGNFAKIVLCSVNI